MPTRRKGKKGSGKKVTQPVSQITEFRVPKGFKVKDLFTIGQMMKATPWKIKQNSKNCLTRLVRAHTDIDYHGVHKRALFHSWDTDGMRRVEIRLYGDYDKIAAHRAWVHCTGPWFMFHSEVALRQRGSSSIINSNGMLPKITNPYMKPKVCKHVYSAIKMLPRVTFKSHPNISEKDIKQFKNLQKFIDSLD